MSRRPLLIEQWPRWSVLLSLWALTPPHLIAIGVATGFVPVDMPDPVEIYAVLGWMLTQTIGLAILIDLAIRQAGSAPRSRRRAGGRSI